MFIKHQSLDLYAVNGYLNNFGMFKLARQVKDCHRIHRTQEIKTGLHEKIFFSVVEPKLLSDFGETRDRPKKEKVSQFFWADQTTKKFFFV
jgi:hypothetical protein